MQRGLEEIARIAARLAHPFASREEVLRAAGLDEAGWETEKARLREASTRLPPEERQAMARAFRSTFANREATAGQSRPTVPAPLAVLAPSSPSAASVPVQASAQVVASAPREMPSYLREAPASRVVGDPLPAMPHPQPRGPVIMETEELDEPAPREQRAATPFPKPATSEPRSTIMASQLPATARPVPFNAAEQAVPPPPTGPAFQSGFTVAARPLPRKSLPFRRDAGPVAAPPAGWDIERYGRLCIDLVRSGLEEAQVLHKAGLSLEQRRLLDRYWEDRMFSEPELRLVWKSACDRRVAEIERGLW